MPTNSSTPARGIVRPHVAPDCGEFNVTTPLFARTTWCPVRRQVCEDQARDAGGQRGARLVLQVHPRRCVIAGTLPAAHLAIDARTPQPLANRAVEQQVIDAQAGIASVGIAEVIPESVDLRGRMQGT